MASPTPDGIIADDALSSSPPLPAGLISTQVQISNSNFASGSDSNTDFELRKSNSLPSGNLFVRFTPQLLKDLMQEMSTFSMSYWKDTRHAWQYQYHHQLQLQEDSNLTFLPIEIQIPSDEGLPLISYASYNGGLLNMTDSNGNVQNDDPCRNMNGKKILEVSSRFWKGCYFNNEDHRDGHNIPSHHPTTDGMTTPDTVWVRPLYSVPYAKTVHVEPVEVKDWELLEVYANTMEAGGLLRQISLVYEGQGIFLSTEDPKDPNKQSDHIHIIIQEIVCMGQNDSSNPSSSSSIWPEDEKAEPSKLGNSEVCPDKCPSPSRTMAILIQSTEVIVTPKPRQTFDPFQWSDPLQSIASVQDIGEEYFQNLCEASFESKFSRTVPNVPHGTVLFHPSACRWWDVTLYGERCWAEMTLASKQGTPSQDKVALVQLSCDSNIPEGTIVIHPLLRLELNISLLWDSVLLRLAKPPVSVPVESLQLCPFDVINPEVYPWRNSKIRDFGPFFALTESKNAIPEREKMYLVVGSFASLSYGIKQCVQIQLVDSHGLDDNQHMIVSLQDFEKLRCTPKCDLQTISFESCHFTMPCPVLKSTFDSLSPLVQQLHHMEPLMWTLSGPKGTGKTYMLCLLGSLLSTFENTPYLYLDCKCLQESTKTLNEILSEIEGIFLRASQTKRCLILFDDLDRIAPNLLGDNGGDPGAQVQGVNPTAIMQSKVIADRLIQLWKAVNISSSSHVSLAASIMSDSSLHTSLTGNHPGILIPALSTNDSLRLLKSLLKEALCEKFQIENLESLLNYGLGQAMKGFRPRDLEKLAARICRKFSSANNILTEYGKELSLKVFTDTLSDVLQDFVPLSHLGLKISPNHRNSRLEISWKDLGGLFDVKKQLEDTILKPVKYRAIYNQAKIRLPRGILLFGPTGCGKSCLIPALGRFCNFPVISCRGPEILDKYIGASEAKIRQLFEQAAAVAPSILFLDELDALAPRRGTDHTGVTDRVVNQLLTFLDGVEDTTQVSGGKTVYIVGASSRPDKIDPALLRPGRLERHLYVGPPETIVEQIDVVERLTTHRSISDSCRQWLHSKDGRNTISASFRSASPFLCPADVKAALDTAHLHAVHRLLKKTTLSSDSEDAAEAIEEVFIEEVDIQMAFHKSLHPCTSVEDGTMLEHIYNRYRGRPIGEKELPSRSPLKTALK